MLRKSLRKVALIFFDLFSNFKYNKNYKRIQAFFALFLHFFTIFNFVLCKSE